MAYTSTAIGTEETTPKSIDKPLFLGRNVLEDYLAMPEWRSGGSGIWGTGSDITASPTRYAFDGYGHLRTYPTMGAYLGFTFLLDLVALHEDSTFDTAVIWNHNFHLLAPAAPTVSVQIADTSDFATNPATVASWTVTDASRLVYYMPSRYAHVRYARLVISSSGSAFTGTAPAFGEFFLARRRQMGVYPEIPWSPRRTTATVADFAAQSGNESRYVKHRGRRILTPSFRCGGTDAEAGLNTETEINALWASSNQGTKRIVFCPEPNSRPNDAIVCLAETDLDVQSLGHAERLFSLSLREQPPFRATETE